MRVPGLARFYDCTCCQRGDLVLPTPRLYERRCPCLSPCSDARGKIAEQPMTPPPLRGHPTGFREGMICTWTSMFNGKHLYRGRVTRCPPLAEPSVSNLQGSELWMAPELIAPGGKPNFQSDIFSLALVIFEVRGSRQKGRGKAFELGDDICSKASPGVRFITGFCPNLSLETEGRNTFAQG